MFTDPDGDVDGDGDKDNDVEGNGVIVAASVSICVRFLGPFPMGELGVVTVYVVLGALDVFGVVLKLGALDVAAELDAGVLDVLVFERPVAGAGSDVVGG